MAAPRSAVEIDELQARLELMEAALREAAAKLTAPERDRPARTQPSPVREVRVVDVAPLQPTEPEPEPEPELEPEPEPEPEPAPEPELVPEPALKPEEPLQESAAHLLFVPAAEGYELVERAGAVPHAGEIVELGDPPRRYAVTRVAPSPLPGDARRCAYVQLSG